MKNKEIYLDYASTTPVDEKVYKEMLPYLKDKFGNPSSLHKKGQEALEAIDKARETVCQVLDCTRKEIIFTSGATESISLAIYGACENKKSPHIITTTIEHSSVLETVKRLERNGVKITYIPPNKSGIINPESVLKACRENTIMAAIMLVNNEIGTIQPVEKISKKIKDKNPNIIIYSDAVQATNYLEVCPKKLGIDMMTLSSHKIYGPKGAGLLYKKEQIPINPIFLGGKQENELRAGTENVAGIVGFASALKNAQKECYNESVRVEKLRNKLLKEILKESTILLNGSLKNRIANNVNISFKNIKSEISLSYLNDHNIFVSSSSACISHTLQSSYVIKEIGKDQYSNNSIRITLGKYTTQKEIDSVCKIIKKLAKINGFKKNKI